MCVSDRRVRYLLLGYKHIRYVEFIEKIGGNCFKKRSFINTKVRHIFITTKYFYK
ncbi:hypothetical protein BFAG_00648 [Bacteroides fragilis 3_1_12]|uniref:Uncharacterized protein n=1 Tax=Bacteroides fragilis 3_1_12 TaxID=457424 RepID=A0ABN0BG86_BACFG|nr:hypothetical protein BFAG_00648 [Bacteroides fragilis 3_1_12]